MRESLHKSLGANTAIFSVQNPQISRRYIDFVVHLPDGRYGLFECKTGSKHIEEGATHLNELARLIRERREKERNVVLREPEVMAIITDGEFAYRREDGIVVCPLSCLKP